MGSRVGAVRRTATRGPDSIAGRRITAVRPQERPRTRDHRRPHGIPSMVESAWGAVPGLLSVRFPRPLAEPAVRFSTQRGAFLNAAGSPRFLPSGVVSRGPGAGDLAT